VSPTPTTPCGPIRLGSGAPTPFVPVARAQILDGLWGERRRINREVSVPHAWERLQAAGNVANLELAAAAESGHPVENGAYVNELPFLDSDLYKWLEAIGWTLADPELSEATAAELRERLTASTDLLRRVQADDGYLDSHFQVRFPGERFVQLPWGHELYCAGHLIQAAVAVHRATGETALLDVARRFADLITASFGIGEGRVDGVCGHPEIETALIELYRETGEQSYLDTAAYFVDRRGHGLLGDARFGRQYFQDHVPVRDAQAVAGHSVRQLYLLAGVADVATETGEPELHRAAERLWSQGTLSQTYLTGGIGAHHTDEAYGDPYELPNERSYCETCAAIASIMFSQRMLLITGEAKYADLLERTLYNGFLAGISLDGERYIYANPLQVRDDHVGAGNDQDYARVPWFACACCPPNVMRLLASLEHYVALAGPAELRLHQFVSGTYAADLATGPVGVDVTTDYPWQAGVEVSVIETVEDEWSLTVRVPHWAVDATCTVNGEPVEVGAADGWWRVTRHWRAGDRLTLTVPVRTRLTIADPRVDAARGCVAIERGPLVYCVESADHPGLRLDDLVLEVDGFGSGTEAAADGLPEQIVAVGAPAGVRSRNRSSWWPYAVIGSQDTGGTDPVELTAIPYFAWGNRGPGAMRIWIPTA
jgi:DUF1680 family protein